MILVAGGTGILGKHLVGLLTHRGHKVRILARNAGGQPPGAGVVEFVDGDVRDPQAVARAVTQVDTVVSAVTGFGPARGASSRSVDWEGNANLIRAAATARVDHFILLSIHRAALDHPIELFRMKRRAEEKLERSGLRWTTIRPTAYMERWMEVLCTPLVETGKTRIFGRGENPINFISAADVARCVGAAVTDPELRDRAVDIGGPEDLTMMEFLHTFQTATGTQGKVKHVPPRMMRVMAKVMKPLNPAMGELMAASVAMDVDDMRFDATALERDPSMGQTRLVEVVRKRYATGRERSAEPGPGRHEVIDAT